MFYIDAIGMNMRQVPSFKIDRPNGSGDYLIIFFKSDAIVTINDYEIKVSPDMCIVYSTGTYQKYRACTNTYMDHFLHFNVEDNSDWNNVDNIPFNQLITLASVKELEDILILLSRENLSQSPNKPHYVDMLIQMLLLKITDSASFKLPELSSSHYSELNELRAKIYSNVGNFHSISELANSINMSPSHFQQLYKMQFNQSCYDDLLNARIVTSQYYLRTTKLTVKEISNLCGYDNDICFMRCFKKRTGMTPSEYRKRA